MSLRDQLLKSGIASKAQHQKVRSAKKKKKGEPVSDATTDTIKEAHQERVRKDQKLNRQRDENKKKKADLAELKQLIDSNKVAREKGERPYRFVFNKHVKTIYLSNQQAEKITRGLLVIVALEQEDYTLIPQDLVPKIEARNPKCILVNQCNQTSESPPKEEDDFYASYKIPDDLTW